RPARFLARRSTLTPALYSLLSLLLLSWTLCQQNSSRDDTLSMTVSFQIANALQAGTLSVPTVWPPHCDSTSANATNISDRGSQSRDPRHQQSQTAPGRLPRGPRVDCLGIACARAVRIRAFGRCSSMNMLMHRPIFATRQPL